MPVSDELVIACVTCFRYVEFLLKSRDTSVMGATGTGKSSVSASVICRAECGQQHQQFINLASGSQLPVGSGLRSCTASVARSKTFELWGRPITLLDTPGFDDTNVSDTDILKMIALYLASM